ncbi:hypothetical protein V2W45_1473041 [Cenococcum geophilum]
MIMHGWRKRWFRLLRAMGVNYSAAKRFLFQHGSLHWASRYQTDGCNYKSDLKAASIVCMQSLRPHSDAWSCESVLQQPRATQITKYKYEEYRECIPFHYSNTALCLSTPRYQSNAVKTLDTFPFPSISTPVTSVAALVIFKRSLYAFGSVRNASSPENRLRKGM